MSFFARARALPSTTRSVDTGMLGGNAPIARVKPVKKAAIPMLTPTPQRMALVCPILVITPAIDILRGGTVVDRSGDMHKVQGPCLSPT